MKPVDDPEGELGELQQVALAAASHRVDPRRVQAALGQHVRAERVHHHRRPGGRGDLGGVGDVVVVRVPDEHRIGPDHLVGPEAEPAHPRAAIVERVEQHHPVVEVQLEVGRPVPADGEGIGIRADRAAQHGGPPVTQHGVGVHHGLTSQGLWGTTASRAEGSTRVRFSLRRRSRGPGRPEPGRGAEPARREVVVAPAAVVDPDLADARPARGQDGTQRDAERRGTDRGVRVARDHQGAGARTGAGQQAAGHRRVPVRPARVRHPPLDGQSAVQQGQLQRAAAGRAARPGGRR